MLFLIAATSALLARPVGIPSPKRNDAPNPTPAIITSSLLTEVASNKVNTGDRLPVAFAILSNELMPHIIAPNDDHFIYACEVENCSFKTNEKSKYDRHSRSHSSGNKNVTCSHCHKDFSHKNKLDNPTVTCSHCFALNVIEVITTSEDGSITPQCIPADSCDPKWACNYKDCTYKSERKADVVRHTKSHLSDRPYKCNHEGCNYAASRKDTLDSHSRTHSGHKPYVCPQCGKSYTAPGNFYSHKKKCTMQQTTTIRKKAGDDIPEADQEAAAILSTEFDTSTPRRNLGGKSKVRVMGGESGQPIPVYNEV